MVSHRSQNPELPDNNGFFPQQHCELTNLTIFHTLRPIEVLALLMSIMPHVEPVVPFRHDLGTLRGLCGHGHNKTT